MKVKITNSCIGIHQRTVLQLDWIYLLLVLLYCNCCTVDIWIVLLYHVSVFQVSVEVFGVVLTTELEPGGSAKSVTQENKLVLLS